MTEINEDLHLKGVGDKFSDVADSEVQEDSLYKEKAEEERERHLQRKNEEDHNLGADSVDLVPGEKGDKVSDVADSEVQEYSLYKETAEEERKRHLQRRNEEVHNLGADSVDLVSGEKGAGPEATGPVWINNPAENIRGYFSMKSKLREEEKQHWEEIGDQDLIGKEKRFGMKRIFWKGSLDSQGFKTAQSIEVKDIFRHCIRALVDVTSSCRQLQALVSDFQQCSTETAAFTILIKQQLTLGAYGNDRDALAKDIQEHDPMFDPKQVIDFKRPKDPGACPPYFICVDHEHREVSMYIRGLNLIHRQDYIALMNNRKGEKPFDGGYVHHGMFGPAEWAVVNAGPVLKNALQSNDGYRLTIVGHSLGAGVAALFTILLVKNREVLGGIPAHLIRAIVFAPPRIMSLDLSEKYSPHLNSIIYQDDFLPRVSTESVKRLFLTTFALTGPVVFIFWAKQAVSDKVQEDVKRLYPPGRIYHFVYKQPGRPGHRPIRARVVPAENVKGRFERLVLSSSATTANHFILTLTKHLKKYQWPEELKDPWLISVLQTAHR